MRGRSQSRSRSRSRRRSPGSNRRHPSQRSYRNRSRSPRRRLQSSNRRSSPASNRGLSRQNAYQDRSRSPRRAQRSNKSRSNSPNRRDQSNPKGIEITLFGSSRSITDKSNGLLIPQNATSSRRSKLGVVLQGPDFGQIDPKELKKIQIDIRRSIPSHRISGSPVRHDIRDPSRISFSRRPDEGKRPMFDRDDIRRHVNSAVLDDTDYPAPESAFRGSRNHLEINRGRDGIMDRSHGGRRNNRHEIIDRDELESRRPQTKPWEVNPEMVPRGFSYFEHDNREGTDDAIDRFRGRGRGRGFSRGSGGFKGRERPFRGSWRGGRGYRGRDPSPEWKHDMFERHQKELVN